MGTIYNCRIELPLSKLGLDRFRVRKLTLDLNTHSIQYATKIINISRRLKNIKERTYGSKPLLPSLMVEICLVLAPNVNVFLNSRKQGLPCWCSLSESCLSPKNVLLLAFVARFFYPLERQLF